MEQDIVNRERYKGMANCDTCTRAIKCIQTQLSWLRNEDGMQAYTAVTGIEHPSRQHYLHTLSRLRAYGGWSEPPYELYTYAYEWKGTQLCFTVWSSRPCSSSDDIGFNGVLIELSSISCGLTRYALTRQLDTRHLDARQLDVTSTLFKTCVLGDDDQQKLLATRGVTIRREHVFRLNRFFYHVGEWFSGVTVDDAEAATNPCFSISIKTEIDTDEDDFKYVATSLFLKLRDLYPQKVRSFTNHFF